MYTQKQLFSTLGPSHACPTERHEMSKMVPLKPQSYAPFPGYEQVDCINAPSLPIVNCTEQPCFTPANMSTRPIKFANLVTGFDRNPINVAKAALYTKYLPPQWREVAQCFFSGADSVVRMSDTLCATPEENTKKAQEEVVNGQKNSTELLRKRLEEIKEWRDKVTAELEQVLEEANLMNEKHRQMCKEISSIETPLHLAQECLVQRSYRAGADKIRDVAEEGFLKETEILRNCQSKLKSFDETIIVPQLNHDRYVQLALEREIIAKVGAMLIDQHCYELNNCSGGIKYIEGIEDVDNTVCDQKSWEELCRAIIEHADKTRQNSAKIREEADNLMEECRKEVNEQWNATNAALQSNINEMQDIIQTIEEKLEEIRRCTYNAEDAMFLLREGILNTKNSLQVANTRLEERSKRLLNELCRDNPQASLVQEVRQLHGSVEKLNQNLLEIESLHQQLLKTRAELETELACKSNAIFIDREKCLALRNSYTF